jgi:hypothetical protein
MMDIQCKQIPLYKFTIYYNEDDAEHSYDYMIIADTFSGLVDAIADREIEYSMSDCRRYLTVGDFLLMPCEQAHRGYYLFDVDNHDIAVRHGLDIDSQHYICKFEGDEPKPVVGFDKIFDYFDEKSDQLKTSTMSLYYDEILASALYYSIYVKKAVAGKQLVQMEWSKVERNSGNEALQILLKGEKNVVS